MAGFSLTNLTDRIFGISRPEDANVVAAGLTTDSALMEMLDGLSNGETIVGKILSVSEDSFRISTGNNITLSAKTQDGISLKEGTSVLFEVSKTADRQVKLRPLYQNTADANTATTALKQASLPINERSLELVARRMEYGEPIDRNSLLEAYRDVQNYEDVPVRYIVDLQQMKLPVTEANLSQYESFMNMTNSISEGLEEAAGGLSVALAQSFDAGVEAFTDFSLSIRQVVDGFEPLEGNPLTMDMSDVMELTTTLREQGVNTNSLDALCFSNAKDFSPEKVLSAMLTDLTESANAIQSATESAALLSEETAGVVYEPSHTDSSNQTVSNASPGLSETSGQSGLHPTSESFAELLTMPAVKDIISRTLVSRGLVSREKLFDREETARMYNRLVTETGQLAEAVASKLNPKGETMTALTNLNNNMDFINTLNTFVPYLQIPFGADGGKHTSELYVFKNKKSFASGDSEITAFLHLDMANLGPTDVYVALKDARVSTNFTLRDEETLEFIEKNIHFLDKRLTEKGYSFNFDAKLEKQMTPPIEKMLSNRLNKIMVSKTSFDARA